MALLDPIIPDSNMTTDVCPHHGRDSSFEWIWRGHVTPMWQQLPVGSLLYGGAPYTEIRAFRCQFCQAVTLVVHQFPPSHPEQTESGVSGPAFPTESRILYPSVSTPRMAPEAPREVASLWEEAAICANAGALRGAAGCLRAAVERIAADKGAVGSSLQKQITDLGKKTGLEPDLVTALHDTRLTGNWSLHDGVEFSRDEIEDLAELVKDTVEILYVQPARRAAMAAARAQRRGGQTP